VLSQNRHDVILLDYSLGAYTGLDILRKSAAAGYQTPTIILAGSGSYETDCMASELGAAGYLDKDQVSNRVLERSLRYAVTYALKHQQKTSFTKPGRISAFGSHDRVLRGICNSGLIQGTDNSAS